jgi:hypothetical protein
MGILVQVRNEYHLKYGTQKCENFVNFNFSIEWRRELLIRKVRTIFYLRQKFSSRIFFNLINSFPSRRRVYVASEWERSEERKWESGYRKSTAKNKTYLPPHRPSSRRYYIRFLGFPWDVPSQVPLMKRHQCSRGSTRPRQVHSCMEFVVESVCHSSLLSVSKLNTANPRQSRFPVIRIDKWWMKNALHNLEHTSNIREFICLFRLNLTVSSNLHH